MQPELILPSIAGADLGDSGDSAKAPKIKKVKHYNNTLTWLQMTSFKKSIMGKDAQKLSYSPCLP